MNYTLGSHFEAFVKAQLASGRYDSVGEVVNDALRLLEEQERRFAELDAALEIGIADADAGRVEDAESVFAELEAELDGLPEARDE